MQTHRLGSGGVVEFFGMPVDNWDGWTPCPALPPIFSLTCEPFALPATLPSPFSGPRGRRFKPARARCARQNHERGDPTARQAGGERAREVGDGQVDLTAAHHLRIGRRSRCETAQIMRPEATQVRRSARIPDFNST
jgi:hypothetical protein